MTPEIERSELSKIGNLIDLIYLLSVRLVLLTLCLLLVSPILGKPVTWATIKRTTEYKTAKLDLAGHLPELAIPKLESLLKTKELTADAIKYLKQLLGESQVRAVFASEALKHLTDSDSSTRQWRAHALVQLGRLREAEKTLAKLEGTDPIRQRALILSSLDQTEDALTLLTPLIGKDPEASLLAISSHLDLGRLDEAQKLLETEITDKADSGLKRFLNGRLQLARGERLSAMGSFQTLLTPAPEDQKLPLELMHAATISLVDSTALDGNEEAAALVALDFIEKNPDSSRLADLFTRLIDWLEFVPMNRLETWSQEPPSQSNAISPYLRNLDPPKKPDLRKAWALYLYGLKNLEGEDPRFGRFLISRIFVVTPDSLANLRQRALVDLGLHHMRKDRPSDALGIFSILVNEASLGEMKAIASSLEGAASFALQDPKQAAKAFAEASSIAQKFEKDNLAQINDLNASLSRLQAGLKNGRKEDPKISNSILQLERGLLFSNRNDPRAREYLSDFITRFTKHPRLNEARLALAESSVFTSPRNPGLAIEQLDGLKFESHELDSQIRKISCLLELSCLLKEKMGLAEVDQFLLSNPKHPAGAELLFRKGRALTCNNQSPLAYVTYEELLDDYPESELAVSARMLSAQAAFSVGNEAAEERAFQRYEELANGTGPLAIEAALERADLRIGRGEFVIALTELEKLLKKKNQPLDDRRRALVLAARAASNANKGEKALGYYKELLAQKELPPAWFNHASFLKGQLLETLGRPLEALEAYNTVIYRNLDPQKTSELEWEFHDRAALEGALPLLERLGKWEAAYETALLVSKSGGPSAERAAQRAKKIQLDKQLFDTAK